VSTPSNPEVTLAGLPSVDELVRVLPADLPRPLRVDLARTAIADARQALLHGDTADPAQLATEAHRRITNIRYRPIVNASGVLLHTNLGRAVLHPDAAAAASAVSISYGNVEFDLNTGERGSRGAYTKKLLTSLTGAEAALVVNNNAAALLLALAALAPGKPVPVSRGELIEIGGSYRLPELMKASGAHLIEVGTTNRTRIGDYEEVANDAAMLLKVHPSNYRVMGFSEEATSAELVAVGKATATPVVFDVGSGLLDTEAPWLPGAPPAWLVGEPGIKQEIAAGVDLALFSGDKLLGGPQAGIIVGRADLVERMRKHPMARALRIDGATNAALSTTLEMYLRGDGAAVPFWQMASRSDTALRSRLEMILDGTDGGIVAGASLLGAGSVPGLEVPTPIAVFDQGEQWWKALLACERPILARRDAGKLLLDLRAVDPKDDDYLATSIQSIGASWR